MRDERNKQFIGKKVLVLGLAKSGFAVAKLLLRKGAIVTVNERSPREQSTGIEELEAAGATLICGGHPLELLDEGYEWIVKNPGIPYDIPFLVEAEKRHIPVITEVEVAYMISKAPIIGITGTNGKTTTTTLTYEMLQDGHHAPLIAGNIGTVLSEVAERATAQHVIVAELSSFQLLGTRTFTPTIGLLLNLYDAHLNYHHTKEHYISSKAKLFANQTEGELAVFNADQEEVRKVAQHVKATVVWFSQTQQVPRGTFIDQNMITYRSNDGESHDILPLNQVALLGKHNLENVLAAITVAREAGASITRIREVLRTFQGVAHRLQFIAEKSGVRYYNDSKATNAQATSMALQSFSDPIVLIAGGLDRGETFAELREVFANQVKGLIAYGQNAHKLANVAERAGVNQIRLVDNVREAVSSASACAQPGDVVLLSPAAASWDQFSSFEERGDMFIQSVHKLR